MAVRKEIAICKIVFQVLAFIMLNVECLMLNVDLVGGCPQARALFKPVAAFLRAAAWLRTAAGSSAAALFSAAALAGAALFSAA